MNVVFLGLGGNKGDSFKILNQTIDEIKKRIGEVIALSSIYETAPWGSNSKTNFLNQVIKITTYLTPLALLKEIEKIEKQFGRKRTKNQNSDRSIDIDILFYNQNIIANDNLIIPHPRLHLRNFVLIPLLEIEKKFRHPLLKKTIAQLAKNCSDQLKVKQIKRSKPLLICIEGNIGVGKTSLAKLLSQNHPFEQITERFENNALLPLFYSNPETFAFSLEWRFLLDRFNQLIEIQKSENKHLLCDFSLYRSLWLASINLSSNDYKTFKKHFNILASQLPKPDLIIYLKTTTSNLISNINNRGRPFEKRIKKLYLDQIHNSYEIGMRQLEEIPVLEIFIESYKSRQYGKVIINIENYIKEKFGKIQQNLYF